LVRNSPALRACQREIFAGFEQAAALADETGAPPPSSRSSPPPGWSASSRSTSKAATATQAIWRKAEPAWHICGIPTVFYTDHGSDFTSQHIEQVAADLRMRLVSSLPASPAAGERSNAT